MTLRDIVEREDIQAGRVFNWAIQFLIVVSLVSFSLETLPDLHPELRSALGLIEVFTVVVFSIEYALRVLVADRRLRYIFSFYGLIDLAAILPFYVARGLDLRSLRIFRLLRLFRALKLLRFSRAIRRFQRAYRMIRAELVLFLTSTVFLLFVSGVGIYYFENAAQPEAFRSVFHSLWWAIATLTTVGYGDVYPVTLGGRIFTFIVLMVGLGVVAVPTGLISSALTMAIDEEAKTEAECSTVGD